MHKNNKFLYTVTKNTQKFLKTTRKTTISSYLYAKIRFLQI